MSRMVELKRCTIDVFEQRTTDEGVLTPALRELDKIGEKDEYFLISFLLPFSLMKHLYDILYQRLGPRTMFLATKVVGFIAQHNPSAVVAEPLVPWMIQSFEIRLPFVIKSALLVLKHVASGDAEQSVRIIEQPGFVRGLLQFIAEDQCVTKHDTEAFQLIKEVIFAAKSKISLDLLEQLLNPAVAFLELKQRSMNTIEAMEILARVAEHRDGAVMLQVRRVHVLLVSLANHYKGNPWYDEPNQQTTFQLLAWLVHCLGRMVSSEASGIIDAVIQQPQFMDAIIAMMEATSGRRMAFSKTSKRELRLRLIYLLANIAGGTPQHIRFVFHNNFKQLCGPIFESMDSSYNPIDTELNRLIANVVENGDGETKLRFLEWNNHKALDVLSHYSHMKKWNVENVSITLETMGSVMKLKTSYCDKLDYCGGKAALEYWVTYANNKRISDLSATMLGTFDRHAEDNLENQQHPNNRHF